MRNLKNRIIAFFTVIGVTILGLMGGQGKIGGKGTRRFGVPGVALIASIFTNEVEWRDFIFLLLIPVLIMGYGENSWLFGVLHADWLVRLVYATLLSCPFLFYGVVRGGISTVVLLLAFQLRAGSLCHLSWFGDILIEDIVRYGSLGGLIALMFLWPKKS
jgi:hypothetical protein